MDKPHWMVVNVPDSPSADRKIIDIYQPFPLSLQCLSLSFHMIPKEILDIARYLIICSDRQTSH